MAEILASLDDVNANLPGRESGGSTSGYPVVVEATDENTYLLQVSVARVVRGYLSSVIDSVTLMSWDEPDNTPEIVREAAAKMIAAQLYFNHAARTNLTIDERNFSQLRYNEAIVILDRIVTGDTDIGVEPIFSMALQDLDFHPIDDTDRAFTMSMEL